VSSRFAQGVAVVAVFAAAVAGGYAWVLRTRVVPEVRVAAESAETKLVACEQGREGEREERAKADRETAAMLSASQSELDELRAEHAEAEKRLAAFKELTDKFRKMIDSGRLEVILRHGRMVVKLPAGVLFDSGSADLSKEGQDSVREVAAILKQVKDRRFMVAGHTDNVPVVASSPFKNNLDLSTARALTVAQHLVTSGMPPSRLVAAGYSQYEPVRSNAHEAGRKENRRIEIVLMPNVTEVPDLPAAAASDAGAPDASVAAKP
jgi:chemotaxis protein MotB